MTVSLNYPACFICPYHVSVCFLFFFIEENSTFCLALFLFASGVHHGLAHRSVEPSQLNCHARFLQACWIRLTSSRDERLDKRRRGLGCLRCSRRPVGLAAASLAGWLQLGAPCRCEQATLATRRRSLRAVAFSPATASQVERENKLSP